MTTTITTFDIAEHLETEEDIREFLKEVSNTGNPSDLTHALNIAVRTKSLFKKYHIVVEHQQDRKFFGMIPLLNC